MKQGELADRLRVDRTTVNKIEQGHRGDVAISQLFAFAEALGTSPIYLLTPRADDEQVELSPGGRTLSAAETRGWVRGVPAPGVDLLDFALDMPRDEQRLFLGALLARDVGSDPILRELAATPERVEAAAAALEQLSRTRRKEE